MYTGNCPTSVVFSLPQNWNAYIGKLSSQDYCFHLVKPGLERKSSFEAIFLSYNNGTSFQPRNHSCSYFMTEEVEASQYGTVDFSLDVFVNRENVKNMSSGILYSALTGSDVGTQIRGELCSRCVSWREPVQLYEN